MYNELEKMREEAPPRRMNTVPKNSSIVANF
jgi:hypothetical protein